MSMPCRKARMVRVKTFAGVAADQEKSEPKRAPNARVAARFGRLSAVLVKAGWIAKERDRRRAPEYLVMRDCYFRALS